MIKPTIGRVVWLFRDKLADPIPALICRVYDDRCINVGGFDTSGKPIAYVEVRIFQDEDGEARPNSGVYAEWMPYQKGQAAKTDALELAAAARGQGPTGY